MKINCDIGERGIGFPLDLNLMDYIHIANIACGGHAGDRDSVQFFCELAKDKNVQIAAHLSYPDRKNFGRASVTLPVDELMHSLNEQFRLMENVHRVKLHGALYNDSAADKNLAGFLTDWMTSAGIREVLCPRSSSMAQACEERGITVLGEAFADRTYTVNPETGRLALTARSEPHGVIRDVSLAVEQVRSIMESGIVSAYVRNHKGVLSRKDFSLTAETVCIHSDSPIALELAEELYSYV
jgi:5-oxoprolinase (ATP-hydrolysing) subunit A